MKSHLIRTFSRLSMVALLICGCGLKARGHDLPRDRSLPPAASANCFATSNVQALPLSDTASPWIHAFQNLLSSAGQTATSVHAAVHNLSSHLTHPAQLPADRLVILAPDSGSAPRPRLHHSQLAQPHWGLDSRRPAKTSATDTNQTLLVHAPALGMPPRPRIERLQQPQVDLARLLSQLDNWQCHISQTLFDQDTLKRTIAEHTQIGYRLMDRALASLGPLWSEASDRGVSVVGPQFVVFDSAAGGHIMLTVSQVRQWNFVGPTADTANAGRAPASASDAAATAASDAAADWLRQAIAPMQQQAVRALSRQLDLAGSTLLQLSRSASNWAPADVAARTTSKQWK